MIITVTPNPAVDVTIPVTDWTLGETHVSPGASRRAGGKGLNVARVLRQTGHEVIATGIFGRDDVAWFAADLGVPLLSVASAAPTRSSFAVHETDRGRVSVVNERGPERSAEEWRDLIGLVSTHASEASCVTVSGSLPPGVPDGGVRELVSAAVRAGSVVIADVSGPALWDAVAGGAQVLKPNRAELARTVGYDDAARGARELIARGALLVVVSLGEDGLIAATGAGVVRARFDEVLAGNATGAGDAAVAALASAIDAGADPVVDRVTLATLAAAWSAAAVTEPLAGSVPADVDEYASRVNVTALD